MNISIITFCVAVGIFIGWCIESSATDRRLATARRRIMHLEISLAKTRATRDSGFAFDPDWCTKCAEEDARRRGVSEGCGYTESLRHLTDH